MTHGTLNDDMTRTVHHPHNYTRCNCLLFLTFSITSMLYQMYHISSLYFAYAVVTSIKMETPKNIFLPSTSLCIYYPNILNRTLVSLKLKEKYPSIDTRDLELSDTQDILTIKDIFTMTPDFNNLISNSNCYHRKHSVHLINNLRCTSILRSIKYFYGNSICYYISLRHSLIHSFLTLHELKGHAFYLDLMYEIVLDAQIFQNVSLIDAYIYLSSHIPHKINSFSVSFSRDKSLSFENSPSFRLNFYFLSYSVVDNSYLSWPYSHCIDRDSSEGETLSPPADEIFKEEMIRRSKTNCMNQCLIENVRRKLNRVPMTTIITNTSYDEYLVTTTDLTDKMFQSNLSEIEDLCRQTCPARDCKETIYLTRLLRTESADQIRFWINAPNQPTIRVDAIAKLSLFDYIVHLFNCTGIWIGLSIWRVSRFIQRFMYGTIVYF